MAGIVDVFVLYMCSECCLSSLVEVCHKYDKLEEEYAEREREKTNNLHIKLIPSTNHHLSLGVP